MDAFSLSLRSVARHEREHKGHAELAGIIDCAANEIDRLRGVLESLTKDPPPTLDEPDTGAEVVIKMREIAREALTR